MTTPLTPEQSDRNDPASLWRVVDARGCILLDDLMEQDARWWARAGEYYEVLQRPNTQEIGA